MFGRSFPAGQIDSSLILAPLLGFRRQRDADTYRQAQSAEVDDGTINAKMQTRLRAGSCNFFFKPARGFVDTNMLIDRPHEVKPTWVKLREKSTPRPSGGYNVMMMIPGARTFFKHVRRSSSHLPAWYRLAEGSRQCFAAWDSSHGNELVPHLYYNDGLNDNRPILTARSGRGAVYSRLGTYNSDGEHTGYLAILSCVSFIVLDKDRDRDEMLRLQVTLQFVRSYDTASMPAIDVRDMHEKWHELVAKAQAGFDKECSILPPDVETWRQLFVAQRKAAQTDHDIFQGRAAGESFRRQVSTLDWQTALARVQEPWQLQVVVKEHCDSKFDDSPHRYDSTSHRVGTMLSRLDCQDARRAQLRQMVTDFVAPCDKGWSYTGD